MTATTLHSLHYTTTTTPLRYNYNYNCSTSHYIQQLWVRWPLQPLQPLQQTQLQPPFGQSVDSLCHPWFTTTNVSYRFPILKLPPPPCAVLLVATFYPPFNGWRYCWNVLYTCHLTQQPQDHSHVNVANISSNLWIHIHCDAYWLSKEV